MTTLPRPWLSIDAVLTSVATICMVDPDDIRNNRRHKSVVLARQLFCHLAHEQCNRSYTEIAMYLGCKSHSGCLHAAHIMARKIKERAPVYFPNNYCVDNANDLHEMIMTFLEKYRNCA